MTIESVSVHTARSTPINFDHCNKLQHFLFPIESLRFARIVYHHDQISQRGSFWLEQGLSHRCSVALMPNYCWSGAISVYTDPASALFADFTFFRTPCCVNIPTVIIPSHLWKMKRNLNADDDDDVLRRLMPTHRLDNGHILHADRYWKPKFWRHTQPGTLQHQRLFEDIRPNQRTPERNALSRFILIFKRTYE